VTEARFARHVHQRQATQEFALVWTGQSGRGGSLAADAPMGSISEKF
jgi:hypothetical protein